MLEFMANLILNQEEAVWVFLGEIDEGHSSPFFVLAFRNRDGSSTAAYIERVSKEELIAVHDVLAATFTVNSWTPIMVEELSEIAILN